jgi:hypothetical protein
MRLRMTAVETLSCVTGLQTYFAIHTVLMFVNSRMP